MLQLPNKLLVPIIEKLTLADVYHLLICQNMCKKISKMVITVKLSTNSIRKNDFDDDIPIFSKCVETNDMKSYSFYSSKLHPCEFITFSLCDNYRFLINTRYKFINKRVKVFKFLSQFIDMEQPNQITLKNTYTYDIVKANRQEFLDFGLHYSIVDFITYSYNKPILINSNHSISTYISPNMKIQNAPESYNKNILITI